MGADLLSSVTLWRLTDCDFLSDHAMIEFALSFSNVTSNVLIEGCLTQRELVGKHFKRSFILSRLDKCNNKDSLDGIVDFIISVIFHASTKSMHIRKAGMSEVLWWSLKISNMRKRVNAARRRLQRASIIFGNCISRNFE